MRLLSPDDLREDALQRDMSERGKRLAEFKQKTATHVWRYHEESGYWLLEPVMDGTPRPAA